MKKAFITTCILLAGGISSAVAQERQAERSARDTTHRLPDTANNRTFHDDSTDATIGNSNLSASSGTAASGAGGQGAVQNSGYNTSSDIYNIERRDSIERVKEDSIQDARKSKPSTGK